MSWGWKLFKESRDPCGKWLYHEHLDQALTQFTPHSLVIPSAKESKHCGHQRPSHYEPWKFIVDTIITTALQQSQPFWLQSHCHWLDCACFPRCVSNSRFDSRPWMKNRGMSRRCTDDIKQSVLCISWGRSRPQSERVFIRVCLCGVCVSVRWGQPSLDVVLLIPH